VPLLAVLSLIGSNDESRDNLPVSHFCLIVILICLFLSRWSPFGLQLSLWAIVSVWLQSCALCWPACLLFVSLRFWSTYYEPLISFWSAAVILICIVSICSSSCATCWPACLIFVWLRFWSVYFEPPISLRAALCSYYCHIEDSISNRASSFCLHFVMIVCAVLRCLFWIEWLDCWHDFASSCIAFFFFSSQVFISRLLCIYFFAILYHMHRYFPPTRLAVLFFVLGSYSYLSHHAACSLFSCHIWSAGTSCISWCLLRIVYLGILPQLHSSHLVCFYCHFRGILY